MREARGRAGIARSGEGRGEGLSARFDRCRQLRPGHVVLVDGSARLTAGELLDLGDRLAVWLDGLGVGQGDVVGFQLPNWWEAVVIGCAAFRLGATLCPLAANLLPADLATMLQRAKARVFFWTGDSASGVGGEAGAISVSVRSAPVGGPAFEDLISSPVSLPAAQPRRDPGPALLLFTSGTSGYPKGVLHGDAGLLAKIDGLSQAHELSARDVMLAPYSVAHIGGVIYNLLMPLATGTRAIFMTGWDAGRALDLIAEQGVTFMSAVPTHFHQVLAHRNFTATQVDSIRLAALGGTRVVPEDVELVGRSLSAVAKRSYGSTEVPTITTSRNSDPLATRANTDGAPIGCAQLLVVDDNGRPLPAMAEGELWVKGPEVLLGYLDPADEQEAFTEDGWFKTGDVARVDENGYLTITGRAKDIIIRGGENIAPAEIERWLIKHPAVEEVAVVGMPDPVLGERACAFVATGDGDFAFETMIAWLRDQGLAPYKLPERLEIRRVLPMTSTGKVRKDVLRAEIARLCH